MTRALFALCVASLAASFASAAEPDWLGFRAPGVASQTKIPAKWSATENIRWKTALPGFGTSSPITVGEHIFITCYSGYGLDKQNKGDKKKLLHHVVCLDRQGKIKWDKSVPAYQPPRIDNQTDYVQFTALHGYASATPVSDGKAVYAFFNETGVFAYDIAGNALWNKSPGAKTHGFGSGASPILVDNLLIVNASVQDESLVAYDKTTGNEVWRAKGIDDAWNTPVVAAGEGGKKEIVVITKSKMVALDPANGQELWRATGSTPPRYICPSAVVADNMIYAVHGYLGPAVAVKPGGKGDVTALWSNKVGANFGSNVSSPAYYDGHLYWVSSYGHAICVDAKTGQFKYKEKLDANDQKIDFYASPTVVDGKIIYVSRNKGAFVVAAQPKYEQLARNTIEEDTSVFNATPVVCDQGLLLRSDKFLYCIGN